jgi:hypothetical protein
MERAFAQAQNSRKRPRTFRVLQNQRKTCEDVRFEQSHYAVDAGRVTAERIDRVMSELTGIPVATFSGTRNFPTKHATCRGLFEPHQLTPPRSAS